MADVVIISDDLIQVVAEGAQGPVGPTGATGQGITLKGSVANTGLLPSTGNTAGDAYMVALHMWVWSGTAWVDSGSLQGTTGNAGAGLVAGGAVGQLLIKSDTADYATGWVTPAKSLVGLTNVDNTTDAAKPVSDATTAALAAKASSSHTHVPSTIGAEAALGLPSTDGMVLASTAAGARSWVAAPAPVGSTMYLYSTCGGF